jgi:hypothetical protein
MDEPGRKLLWHNHSSHLRILRKDHRQLQKHQSWKSYKIPAEMWTRHLPVYSINTYSAIPLTTNINKQMLTLCRAQWSHLQLCKLGVHVALLSVDHLHTPVLHVLALVCTTEKIFLLNTLCKQKQKLTLNGHGKRHKIIPIFKMC